MVSPYLTLGLGGHQSEEGLSAETEHGPVDVTSSNSASASRGCLDEGFTRSHSGVVRSG